MVVPPLVATKTVKDAAKGLTQDNGQEMPNPWTVPTSALFLAAWVACSMAAGLWMALALRRRRHGPRRVRRATPVPDVARAVVDGLVEGGVDDGVDERVDELVDGGVDDLVDDPISVVSARLFGRGVHRQERMTVLRFLGILLAEADAGGRLRLNPVDLMVLGHQHGLTADEVDASLGWLEEISALERRNDAWVIADYVPMACEPPPIEALEAIANVLARPLVSESGGAASREDVGVVAAAAAATGPEVGVGGVGLMTDPPARTRVRMASRWQAGAALVGVAAAIVAGLVYVSSGGPSSGPRVVSAAGPGSTVTKASGQPSQTVASDTIPASTSPVFASRGVTGLDVPTGSAPVTGTAAAPACPQGGPVAAVDSVVTTVEPLFVTSLPPNGPALQTTVSGTLRNSSGVDVHVVTLLVYVHYQVLPPIEPNPQTVQALSAPVTLSPGTVLPWKVSTKTHGTQTGPATATAQITSWSWADSALATACPH